MTEQKSKTLTPSQWEKEYSEGTPHWAKDMNPSEFAQDFAKELKRRKLEDILEIGCGNGRDSIFFAKSGFNVKAIDVAPSAIELAESNIKKAKVFVDTQLANANDLLFPTRSIDAVFSLSVLHSSNLDLSIPEIYRVLGHGGYAFIYIYGDTQFADGKTKQIIDTDKYIILLQNTGFKIIDFYTEQEDKYDEFGEKHKLLVAMLEKR